MNTVVNFYFKSPVKQLHDPTKCQEVHDPAKGERVESYIIRIMHDGLFHFENNMMYYIPSSNIDFISYQKVM